MSNETFRGWGKTHKDSDAAIYAVRNQLPLPVTWKAKVKQHGSNAGYHYVDGECVASQSRNQMLGVDRDNYQTEAFRRENVEALRAKTKFNGIMFCERAGQGVQGGVAVSQIGRKALFVFGLWDADAERVIFEPEEIAAIVPDHPDIYVIPWYQVDGEDFTFTLNHNHAGSANTDDVYAQVELIDKEDPYIKEVFGVSGIGEGLVFTALGYTEWSAYCGLRFKVKGESHKKGGGSGVKKNKNKNPLSPEQYATVCEMVKREVNEDRCHQGVREACGGEFTKPGIGKFIRWMVRDIQEETINEREASNLPWKHCGNSVALACKEWYMARLGGDA